MKFFIITGIFILLLSCAGCNISHRATPAVVIDNELFSKNFYCPENHPGKIEVVYQRKDNQEVMNAPSELPFFDLVINGKRTSSNDKLWRFRAYSVREMDNGGKEYSIVFEGIKNHAKGLHLVVLQQIFPGSAVMREKMILKSLDKAFTLNKLDGRLYFRFPGYSVKNESRGEIHSTEIRIAAWDKKPITFGDSEKGNYMYFPDIRDTVVTKNQNTLKGPVSIISNGEISWLTAYEHASQDGFRGMVDTGKLGDGNRLNDAMQGTKGIFNFPVYDSDFMFLGISNFKKGRNFNVSVDMLRGGYLEGEIIDEAHPYPTVWTATGFYDGNDFEKGQAIVRNYLLHEICEKPASRIPEYYYNTWGMQREDKTRPLRDILTYERIFREIDHAAELGVDIFVLDDGWENKQGEWFPNTRRFPEGLAPIKERLDKYGIKMGLWFSPMGIDSTSRRYSDHPEWVIKDSEGKPIQAQWGHPAFDFVSGFSDLFIDDCKKLIDQGCRFMKWDAINTFYSTLPGLHHGSENHPSEEIRARYEYLLPIYVIRAMEILTDYEPELVIEVDLTEARRAMVGLAPLSQGKLFWMNNGASWYNDYTTFRTKSMRTIANEFAGIIPLELFTYANYPQNLKGAMKYNVTNSLLAGHGFWGNLDLMSRDDRIWVGEQVAVSKKVLPLLVDANPLVNGEPGDSPEIYSIVNGPEAAGQVVVFSEESFQKQFSVEIDQKKLLAVVNHPYVVKDGKLVFNFMSNETEYSVAAIILPNHDSGMSVIETSTTISAADMADGNLAMIVSAPGELKIAWDAKNGKPEPASGRGTSTAISEEGGNYLISVRSEIAGGRILIKSRQTD